MEKNEAIKKDTTAGPRKGDKVDRVLDLAANVLVMASSFFRSSHMHKTSVARSAGSPPS